MYIIGHPIAGVPLRRPLPAGANDLLLPTALPSCARYTAFSLYLQRELIEFSKALALIGGEQCLTTNARKIDRV